MHEGEKRRRSSFSVQELQKGRERSKYDNERKHVTLQKNFHKFCLTGDIPNIIQNNTPRL
eukprot:Pgem_evm2s5392